MTKLMALTLNMARNKVKTIHGLFGIYVLVTLVLSAYQTLRYHVKIGGWIEYAEVVGAFATFIVFLIIVIRTEKILDSSTYRLIPITEGKLYTANIVSTIVAFLYFELLNLIFTFLLNPVSFIRGLNSTLNDTPLSILLIMVAMIFAMFVLIVALVTLMHLVNSVGTTFLPAIGQKITRVVMVVLSIVVVSYVFGGLQYLVSLIFTRTQVFNSDNGFWVATALSPVYVLALALVISAVNMYLLRNWVEIKVKAG